MTKRPGDATKSGKRCDNATLDSATTGDATQSGKRCDNAARGNATTEAKNMVTV